MTRLVFLDESACKTGMCREHAWSLRGERAVGLRAARRWTTLSMIGAIRIGRKPTLMTCKGAINGRGFVRFIRRRLVRYLDPGDIVVMDNLSVHKSTEARSVIEAAGASILFMPTYSPEYNPIELWWSDLKRDLRRVTASTTETLLAQVQRLRAALPIQKISGWFRHCVSHAQVN
jgi:transposase